ncbi:alpha/beta fold hydrolase [Micromonospora sp. NPDC049175]|uniref:alpha/beta fold hydrolase n=1 Tax=Micromonospora sp. NPDC049175 TaxID=3364266 RepID=UPI00371ADF00
MGLVVRTDDNCRLWAEQSGTGPPLVLCHGGPGLWDYLGPVAGLLDDRARTVRWDQRGCGRSQRRGPYRVGRFVADLDAVRDQLVGPRMALLGHSWGAHLALRYAIAHPERVSHLIYVSGTGIDPDRGWHPHYERNLRLRLGQHLGRWETLGARSRTPAEERERAVLQWSADFADHADALRHAERMATPWLGINDDCNQSINAEVKQELRHDGLVARCRALDLPVLIIDGTEDIRPRWAVDSLHQAFTDSQRVSLAGSGHLPWVENPDGFREAVTAFLAYRGRQIPDAPVRFRARVRHEPDRSYAVLVEGPEAEVYVGTTRSTREVRTVAREGAARLFGVPTERIAEQHLDVEIPQPPYGRDGQWVRVVSTGGSIAAEDVADLGAAGQAHWFGREGAWFVTVAGSGTAVHPSEHLDFTPVLTAVEVAELRSYLARSAQPPS